MTCSPFSGLGQSGKSWLVKDVVSTIHKGVEAEFDNGG